MTDRKIQGIYTQKDDLNSYVKVASNKKITNGKLKGQTYSVYTKTEHHSETSWKVKRGALAFAATFFSAGTLLFVPAVREWWKQARTGDEVSRIKHLDSKETLSNGNNQTAASTNQSGQNVLQVTNNQLQTNNIQQPVNNKSQQFGSNVAPNPTPILNPANKPPEPKPAPKNTYGFAVLEKKDAKDKVIYPSINDIKPQDARLDMRADIYKPEHDMYSNRMHHVMEMPLYRLPTLSEGWGIDNLAGIADVDHQKSFVKRIKDRFDLLDGYFDLKNRLASSDFVEQVQIQDIDCPWNESALKVMLLNDKEFSEVTLETIKNSSARQRAVLFTRFARGVAPVACPQNLDAEKFAKLTLSQIHQVPVDQLDRFITTFNPKEMLQLLSEDQLCALDIPGLSQPQFDYVYSKPDRIQKLVPPRLQQFIRHLDGSRSHLSKLTDSQIQAIDFKDETLVSRGKYTYQDREYDYNGLNQLAIIGDYDKDKGRGIRALTPQQVVDCLNRGLFDEKTAEHISPEHLDKINFKDVKDLVKAGGAKFTYGEGSTVFTAMIRSQKIKKLTPPNLEYLLPHLQPGYLSELDDSQIQAINFKNEKIVTQEQFKKLAVIGEYDKDKGRGIRALTSDQMVECLKRGLFDTKTAIYITPIQVENANFKKIINLQTAGGSQVISAMATSANIKKLTPVNLDYLLPYLSEWRFTDLDDSQIQEIDFSKGKMTKPQFDQMADMQHGYTLSKEDGRGIRALKSKQIIDCLSKNLFVNKTAGYLTDLQIRELDAGALAGLPSTPIIESIKQRKTKL